MHYLINGLTLCSRSELPAASARSAEGRGDKEPAEVLILMGQMCFHLRALMFGPNYVSDSATGRLVSHLGP